MKIPPYKKPDPERINVEPMYMTPEGIERLREKLARLKRNLPKLAEETARTAAFGDRSDNAEYKMAKGALRHTTYESYRIEDQLKRVVPITHGVNSEGTIQLGSVVTLQSEGKKEQTYEILGPDESDPTKGRISNKSPLGAALMDKKKGDSVTIQMTNGRKEYLIVNVE